MTAFATTPSSRQVTPLFRRRALPAARDAQTREKCFVVYRHSRFIADPEAVETNDNQLIIIKYRYYFLKSLAQFYSIFTVLRFTTLHVALLFLFHYM